MALQRFLFQHIVTAASGTQTFYVDALDAEVAQATLERGGGVLYESALEVGDLSAPELIGVTDLTDFGDYPPAPAIGSKDDVLERALEAFWAVVAGAYPQAQSGDLAPDADMRLGAAAEQALAQWVESNVPAAGAA